MSIFTALKRARMKMEEFPGTTFQDASRLCLQTTSDGSPHDYQAASKLHTKLPEFLVDLDNSEVIRKVLNILILEFKFDWVYFFPSGREAVKSALNRDEYQVFRNADLFLDSPSLDIVTWWDQIANKFRTQIMDNVYREAELKSLNLERELLKSLNCPYEPVWVALNDNSLGFDIRSYRMGQEGWVPFAIEVKSSSTGRLRFFLTRNEFNLASRMKSNYELHYWANNSLIPVRFDSNQLIRNAPKDSGKGKWDSMIIEANLSDSDQI